MANKSIEINLYFYFIFTIERLFFIIKENKCLRDDSVTDIIETPSVIGGVESNKNR